MQVFDVQPHVSVLGVRRRIGVSNVFLRNLFGIFICCSVLRAVICTTLLIKPHVQVAVQRICLFLFQQLCPVTFVNGGT